MAENRKQFRFLIPGSIVMQSIEEAPRISKGLVVDFGKRGAGIHSEVLIEKGVEVKFLMMNKDYDFKFKGTGRIVNYRLTKTKNGPVYRLGLEFTSVDEKELDAIIENIQAMGW